MNALSGDGLYDASWSTGQAVPYVNSEGENGELYDALLAYDYIGLGNPYDHGLSAFGAFYDNAVCVELTWLEEFAQEFTGDFKAILSDFLNSCSYREDMEEPEEAESE